MSVTTMPIITPALQNLAAQRLGGWPEYLRHRAEVESLLVLHVLENGLWATKSDAMSAVRDACLQAAGFERSAMFDTAHARGDTGERARPVTSTDESGTRVDIFYQQRGAIANRRPSVGSLLEDLQPLRIRKSGDNERVRRAMRDELTDRELLVTYLHYGFHDAATHGMSLRQVARYAGCSKSAADRAHQSARQKLAAALRDTHGYDL